MLLATLFGAVQRYLRYRAQLFSIESLDDHQKARSRAGLFPFFRFDPEGSVLDLRRQLAAVGCELGHHLLVQPDIHARGIVGVAGIAELLGEFFARGEA